MRTTRIFGATVVVLASAASVALVRADQAGRSRDTIARPGERVEVVASFDGVAGRDVTVVVDGRVVGTARTDATGLVRFALAAPSVPGLHDIRFVLGGSEARAALAVVDPARPLLLIDLTLLANRPDARNALGALAQRYQLVYFTDSTTANVDALRANATKGPFAKVKAGGLAPWLRGLAGRGIRFETGLVSTSEQALALQSVGSNARIGPASLAPPANVPGSPGVGNAPSPTTARPPLGELEGSWRIVDPSGTEKGVLDLSGAGPNYNASRDRALFGTAQVSGDVLDVTFANPGSTGFSGAMGTANGGATSTTTDRYVRDPVEGAFYGAHAGAPESLRRGTGGNAVDILVDGAEMLPAYLMAIHSAQRSIHIESYIWRDEESGRAITDALCERLQAGVQVRAIMDGVGSMKAGALRDRIKASGGKVITYNPVSFSNIGAFFKTLGDAFSIFTGSASARDPSDGGIDNRDHRKVLVIDGATAFTGGIGFANDDVMEWHDLHARVRGPVVARIQRHFEDVWRAGGGGALAEDPAVVYPQLGVAGPLALDVLTTVPGVRAEIKRAYLAKVASARQEVLIENPYFADDELIAALKAKARTGVPVTLILPVDDKNDVKMVGALHARMRPDLWNAGIRLLDYPKMTHGKVAIVDGKWSTIGSCNLDNRSFMRNLEINVSCEDPRFAADMRARVFDVDVRVAQPWTPASPPRTFMQKAWGVLANAFRDWL